MDTERAPHWHGNAAALPLISLFSGCGGLDVGFEREGFRPLLAVDMDRAACETYAANRRGQSVKVICTDLSTVAPVQLLRYLPAGTSPRGVIGAPPCPAFSVSNVHKIGADPRSRLPLTHAAIVAFLNQTCGLDFFLFENVFGIRTRRHKEQFALFKQRFAAAGFTLFESELDAAGFGVPQHRRRVFLVGFNRERYGDVPFAFPQSSPGPYRTVRHAIGDLGDPVFFERGLQPEEIRERAGHPNHWAMQPRSTKFANQNGELVPGDRRGRAFRVLEWDAPSPTVAYGHREVHVHPSMTRRLSVYEAMRLQGFPPSYELRGTLSDQIRMVSDAVPPPLAAALASVIKARLH